MGLFGKRNLYLITSWPYPSLGCRLVLSGREGRNNALGAMLFSAGVGSRNEKNDAVGVTLIRGMNPQPSVGEV